jgi:hypothetical protein
LGSKSAFCTHETQYLQNKLPNPAIAAAAAVQKKVLMNLFCAVA